MLPAISPPKLDKDAPDVLEPVLQQNAELRQTIQSLFTEKLEECKECVMLPSSVSLQLAVDAVASLLSNAEHLMLAHIVTWPATKFLGFKCSFLCRLFYVAGRCTVSAVCMSCMLSREACCSGSCGK